MCYNITTAADLETCRSLRNSTAIYLSRAIGNETIPFTFTNLECKKNIVQLLAFLLGNVFGPESVNKFNTVSYFMFNFTPVAVRKAKCHFLTPS